MLLQTSAQQSRPPGPPGRPLFREDQGTPGKPIRPAIASPGPALLLPTTGVTHNQGVRPVLTSRAVRPAAAVPTAVRAVPAAAAVLTVVQAVPAAAAVPTAGRAVRAAAAVPTAARAARAAAAALTAVPAADPAAAVAHPAAVQAAHHVLPLQDDKLFITARIPLGPWLLTI